MSALRGLVDTFEMPSVFDSSFATSSDTSHAHHICFSSSVVRIAGIVDTAVLMLRCRTADPANARSISPRDLPFVSTMKKKHTTVVSNVQPPKRK